MFDEIDPELERLLQEEEEIERRDRLKREDPQAFEELLRVEEQRRRDRRNSRRRKPPTEVELQRMEEHKRQMRDELREARRTLDEA